METARTKKEVISSASSTSLGNKGEITNEGSEKSTGKAKKQGNEDQIWKRLDKLIKNSPKTWKIGGKHSKIGTPNPIICCRSFLGVALEIQFFVIRCSGRTLPQDQRDESAARKVRRPPACSSNLFPPAK